MKVESELEPSGISPARSSEQAPASPARRWLLALLVFALLAIIVIAGVLPRIQARATLNKETQEMAIPAVAVVHPKPSSPAQEVVLPANVQAFIDAPIYARTNGYLRK